MSADLESEIVDPAMEEFREIFKKFSTAEELCGTKPSVRTEPDEATNGDDTEVHTRSKQE